MDSNRSVRRSPWRSGVGSRSGRNRLPMVAIAAGRVVLAPPEAVDDRQGNQRHVAHGGSSRQPIASWYPCRLRAIEMSVVTPPHRVSRIGNYRILGHIRCLDNLHKVRAIKLIPRTNRLASCINCPRFLYRHDRRLGIISLEGHSATVVGQNGLVVLAEGIRRPVLGGPVRDDHLDPNLRRSQRLSNNAGAVIDSLVNHPITNQGTIAQVQLTQKAHRNVGSVARIIRDRCNDRFILHHGQTDCGSVAQFSDCQRPGVAESQRRCRSWRRISGNFGDRRPRTPGWLPDRPTQSSQRR